MSENSIKVISDKNNPYFKNNKIESGNAIPTTGTYAVGDMIINTTPTNGIYAWVCATAGTPGTWIVLPTMDHTHNYASSSSAGGPADNADKLENPINITLGNTTKSFDGTTNITWTLDELGVSAEDHNHTSFMAHYNSTGELVMPPTTISDGELRFDSRIMKTTTDLFTHTSNANAIFTINKYTGAYNSQLGFSSNGNIYYRNTNATGTAWKQLSMGNSYCKNVANTDLNNLKTSGKYHGSGLTNSPDGTSHQFYIEVMNRDSGQLYVHQRAIKLNSINQVIYDRFMRNGTWYAWRKQTPKVFPRVFRDKLYTAKDCTAARSGAAVTTVNGFMMVIGGEDTSGNATNTNYRYSPYANAWSTRKAMSVKLGYCSAATVGDKIFVTGGYTGSAYNKVTYCYDYSENAWTTKASIPASEDLYTNNAMTSIGNMVYYVNTSSGKIYKYDTTTNAWTTISTSIPQSRSYGAVTSDGTRYIYQTGGYSGYSRLAMQVFDTTNSSWTTKAKISSSVEYQRNAAVYFNNKVYFVGGIFSISDISANTAIYVYDIAGNKWSGYAKGVHGRNGVYSLGSVVLYGNIYSVGGYSPYDEEAIATTSCYVPN